MTPEEINACKPGDKVRLDGLVLVLHPNGWWRTDNRTGFRSADITKFPGVTVTKLEEPLKVGDVVKDDETYWIGQGPERIVAIDSGLAWLKSTQDDYGNRIREVHFLKAVRGEKT